MEKLLPNVLIVLLFGALTLSSNQQTAAQPREHEKPNIWVYTDLSDPRDRRSDGHPQNDPDDIVSLASLLLSAHRYNIVSVVVGSTNRKNLSDPMPFVNDLFVTAYHNAWPRLSKHYPGLQAEIDFQWSALTQQPVPEKFDPHKDYQNLDDYPSVKSLVEFAKNNPLEVLSWGPLTESAIAVKHLLAKGDMATLKNIRITSHWTMSRLAQGTPEQPFHVANCRDDAGACDFLHQQAKQNPQVQFIELGAVGQKGLVNGSGKFDYPAHFSRSQLGQLFYAAKFYSGKPDQSDASSHWLYSGDFGLSPSLYSTNGELPIEQESLNTQAFWDASAAIMEDLSQHSLMAAGVTFPEQTLADYFTYVYERHNHYHIYVPIQTNMRFSVKDSNGDQVLTGELPFGNHTLTDLAVKPSGSYQVDMYFKDWHRSFWL